MGREQEIDQLVQALSKANGTAAVISGVRGMGGIGKTELVYVVANRVKNVYPDAQIVLDLRGASSNPQTPEQVLQSVITSFVRETKLPDDLNQLQALYRSLLAGKRVLVVADDAGNRNQVLCLLPPQGCALIITSRNRFSIPGMQKIDLDLMSPEEATKLLQEICPLLAAEADELAVLCGYLPLALRIS